MNPIEAIKRQAQIIYDASRAILEYAGPLEEAVAPLVRLTRADDAPVTLGPGGGNGDGLRVKVKEIKALKRRGRRAAAAVGGALVGGGVRRRGSAFGWDDLLAALGQGPCDRCEVAKRLKAAGIKGDLEMLKKKVSIMCSPGQAKGRVERNEEGLFCLPEESKPKRSRRGKACGAGPVADAADAGADGRGVISQGELREAVREQLGRGPLSLGALANIVAPMFPSAGKKDVADAILALLQKGGFHQNAATDWELR